MLKGNASKAQPLKAFLALPRGSLHLNLGHSYESASLQNARRQLVQHPLARLSVVTCDLDHT